MSSRIVIVSQLFIPGASGGGWDKPTELYDFGTEDTSLAKAYAYAEWQRRMAELIAKDKVNDRKDLPWLERISVCYRISGIGRGGSDHIAIEDSSLRLTVGLE